MKEEVAVGYSFHCYTCHSANLTSKGAVLTTQNKIYIVFQCECGEAVLIGIDTLMAQLYGPIKRGNGDA